MDQIDNDLLDFLQRALAAQRAVDDIIPRARQARERMPDGTHRVRCSLCGKSVSNPLPVPVIIRAFVQCPECLNGTKGQVTYEPDVSGQGGQ